MSSQTLNFNFAGLYTFPSDISQVPQGSLAIARNVNISRQGLCEPRRGFDVLTSLPNPTDRAKKLFFYADSLLVAYGTAISLFNGSWTSKGTISEPTNATSIRSVATALNLYLTSSQGIKKLDSISTSIYQAGVPNALHSILSLVSGVNLAVSNNSSRSYRWVLARKDANKNIVVGGVSPKNTITNTSGGARDVGIRCYLPANIDNTYYAQIYATTNVATPAVNGEEFQLVVEHNITSAEVTLGYFDESDITPDALLGASLYTNPSQQGLINNNAIPPLARDITSFKGITFYADVESFHRSSFTLTACGTTGNQLRVDDTITVSNGTTTEVYTGKATENVGSKQFFVDVASSSPATRIDNTIKSLINVINRGSALVYGTIDAVSSSDLPGQLTLQGRLLGSAAFTTVSSRSAAFNPTLTTPAGTNQTSNNSAYKNGLMYSKKDHPESVSLKNVLFVGSSDDRIKRIIPLRDSLLIFKEKDGVYRLSGENEGSFTVSLLDSTAKLVSPDSLAVMNGSVWGLFETGICQVTDSDVSIVSLPIKDKLLTLFGGAYQATRDITFAIPYETDGKYILCLPSNSADSYSTYQLVYDVFGDTFVEWDIRIRCAGVNPSDGLLYSGTGNSSRIRSERKTYEYTDFADFEQNATLTAFTGLTLTISGTDSMAVGDLLNQDALLPVYITSVNTAAGTVEVDLDQTWDLGLVEHYKGIEVELEWNKDTSGNPAGLKHFAEVSFPFNKNYIGNATFSFSSDVSPGVNPIVKAGPQAQGNWGYGVWGEGVFGGAASPSPVRLGVPRTSARCNALSVKFSQSVAFSDFQLAGIALTFSPTSVRTAR